MRHRTGTGIIAGKRTTKMTRKKETRSSTRLSGRSRPKCLTCAIGSTTLSAWCWRMTSYPLPIWSCLAKLTQPASRPSGQGIPLVLIQSRSTYWSSSKNSLNMLGQLTLVADRPREMSRSKKLGLRSARRWALRGFEILSNSKKWKRSLIILNF